MLKLYKILILLLLTLLLAMLWQNNHEFLSIAQNTTDRNQQQLAKIDRLETDYRFAVMGDNQSNQAVLENTIERLNRENLDFIFFNGDLVNDGNLDEFAFKLKIIDQSKAPVITSIGNHELHTGRSANYQKIFGPTYYSFALGNNYFIVLDTSRYYFQWFGEEQLRWLERELIASQVFTHRFVMMHVPFTDPRYAGYHPDFDDEDIKVIKQMEQLFNQYRVSQIFTSHYHGFDQGQWGQTPYLTTGGAGAERFGNPPANDFFNYIIVDVSADSFRLQVQPLPDPWGYSILKIFYVGYFYLQYFFWLYWRKIFIFTNIILLVLIIVKR